MRSVHRWLLPTAQQTEEKQDIDHEQNDARVDGLYRLHGLRNMPQMNGATCKIVGSRDNQDRYPCFVYKTKEIVSIKAPNLSPIGRGAVFVKDLILYPIKGCKGVSLPSCDVDALGLQSDREYCLWSTKSQRIVSQSFRAKMCWIEPHPPSEKGITISAPHMRPASIFVPKSYDEQTRVCLPYWNYKQGIGGFDQGDEASKWLTTFFINNGYSKSDETRLILLDPSFQRITHKKDTCVAFTKSNHAQKELKQSVVSFSNEFQFLMVSQESLDALNARIQQSSEEQHQFFQPDMNRIKMDRFRPNIVLSSNGDRPPHFEDNVKRFSIDNMRFYHTKPCPRCAMPSIHQQTAKRCQEPKQTLLRYRTGQQLKYLKERNWSGELFFGSYFIHDKCGKLARGDILTLG